MRVGSLTSGLGDDAGPQVTIGLPVYNGERRLAEALTSLLALEGPSFVVRIFDNASTDRTREIAEEFARRDARVIYSRNETNVGAFGNFMKALDSATTPFFMWASDDDRWQANFLSELSPLLLRDPACVLATPAAIALESDGSYAGRVERAAPAADARRQLKSLFRQNASCWIYGLYRTEWLKREAPRWATYPTFGSDVLWLATVVMNERVAGSDRTAIFKRQRKGGVYYASDEEGYRLWTRLASAFRKELAAKAPNASLRRTALFEAMGLVYRSYVRRTNPFKATLRPLQFARYAIRQALGRPVAETDLFAERAISGASGERKSPEAGCERSDDRDATREHSAALVQSR